MQESKRKPFNNDAGYRASRRTSFGWVVIYDRKAGADWIDADTRWVVAAYDQDKANIALIECGSFARATEVMKDTQAGDVDWIQGSQE